MVSFFKSLKLIAANEHSGLKIYPNPFSNKFEVSWNNYTSRSLIKASISDALDKIVLQKEFVPSPDLQHVDFDLSAFEPGFYFITLSTANESFVRKIIKQ